MIVVNKYIFKNKFNNEAEQYKIKFFLEMIIFLHQIWKILCEKIKL